MTHPVLEAIGSGPDRAGLFVDFDGTLSHIAPTPEQARAAGGAGAALEGLGRRLRLVAVVTGRRAAEVHDLLGSPSGVRCYGLYGLEDRAGPTHPEAKGMVERIEALVPEVTRAAALVPGARVEPKGLQVAVHYRAAADPVAARQVLTERLAEVADRAGLRLLEGKRVIELAPSHGPTKGDVVTRATEELDLEAILYAGDDVADLDAFAEVERLRSEGRAGVTVAVRSAETSDQLIGRADLAVDGPGALVRLLEDLLDSITGQ